MELQGFMTNLGGLRRTDQLNPDSPLGSVCLDTNGPTSSPLI
jgi:hypothetical protein